MSARIHVCIPVCGRSVQGFGRRGGVGWFYPGSGATADSVIAEKLAPPPGTTTIAAPGATESVDLDAALLAAASAAAPPPPPPPRPPAAAAAASAADAGGAAMPDCAGGAGAVPSSSHPAAALNGGGGAGGQVLPEDPDGEFKGSYDVTVLGGPRVVNVGIPGPGEHGADRCCVGVGRGWEGAGKGRGERGVRCYVGVGRGVAGCGPGVCVCSIAARRAGCNLASWLGLR